MVIGKRVEEKSGFRETSPLYGRKRFGTDQIYIKGG
jgi:hypothetical protein